MTQTKQKYLLATIVSLLGAAATIPMVVSGTANAQEGSRLCGRIYQTIPESDIPKETVIRLYEVRKNDPAKACEQVAGSFDASKSPFNFKSSQWDRGTSVSMTVCEAFGKDFLGGRGLTFTGDNWPANDQNDICNNMNRSDTIFEMERYWLYDDDGKDNWEFVRG